MNSDALEEGPIHILIRTNADDLERVIDIMPGDEVYAEVARACGIPPYAKGEIDSIILGDQEVCDDETFEAVEPLPALATPL